MKLPFALLSSAILALAAYTPLATAADTYTVDPVHSFVGFKVKHMGAGYAYGMINVKSGSIVVDEADPTKSSVEVVLDPATIHTGNEKRDGHLKGADFFNAKEFPEITFKSTSVTKSGEGKAQVVGDLTLLGKTKPVTAELTEVGKGQGPKGEVVRGAEAVFSFKRSDFGMNFGIEKGALDDEVWVTVAIEGKK